MRTGTVRPKGRAAYKPNTVRASERALVNHLEGSELARLTVADVRRAVVQALADELLAEGLAPGTVSNVALYRRLIGRDVSDWRTDWRTTAPGRSGGRLRSRAAQLGFGLPEPFPQMRTPRWGTGRSRY